MALLIEKPPSPPPPSFVCFVEEKDKLILLLLEPDFDHALFLQVTEQGKLEDELISMKRKTSIVTRERDQGKYQVFKNHHFTQQCRRWRLATPGYE